MKTEKKIKIMALVLTIFTIILLIGLTIAYFSASVSNENNEKFQTETATMHLVFSDNDNGVSANLNLGESIVKKFTIENTGTVDAYGKINWYNLVNIYLPNSLTWTLEQSTTENGTYATVGSGSVPTSSTATTAVLKNGLLVPVNTTYYYKLTITLNNLDIDQTSDIDAHMNSKFSLENGNLTGADQIMNLVADANPASTGVITKQAPTGETCTNTLAYDGTTDNNLRYVGADPCNYVTFNEETAGWRIVGVMNNVDDGTGKLETRIKLVRATSLRDCSWDSSASSVNNGYGINDWTQADLKNELNGDYLDTTLQANTNWYNGSNNAQSAIFDITKRLGLAAQGLIGDAKWYLGGVYKKDGTASSSYEYERGNTVWGSETSQTCNDGYCPRATEWIGKVALAYPSDYGYAVGGTARTTCLPMNLFNNGYLIFNCDSNDWLKGAGWMLSPVTNDSSSSYYKDGSSYVVSYRTYVDLIVKPVIYLKTEASISGGNGSISEPYVIE